jgi:hypothetical protein
LADPRWDKCHLDEKSPGVSSLRFEQQVRAEAPLVVRVLSS